MLAGLQRIVLNASCPDVAVDIVNDPDHNLVAVQVEDGKSVHEVANAITDTVLASNDRKSNQTRTSVGATPACHGVRSAVSSSYSPSQC